MGSDAQGKAATYEAYLARPYFAPLDGLRAVSVLLVVGVHMHDKVWGWLGGQLGVTVFFVLSGYLITTLAVREERARGALCLSAFFVRRTFRILPLFYLVLGLYCLLIFGLGLNPEKRPQLAGALPWYATYLQEVPFFYGVNGSFADIPFYQTWSLGIEEKFYLVWPLLGFVLWRARPGPRAAGAAVLLVIFATAHAWAPDDRLAGCLQPYAIILFGCLIALVLDRPRAFARLRFLGAGPWPVLTLALLVAAHAVVAGSGEARPGTTPHVLYALAVGPFLASVLLGDHPVSRGLAWGPLQFVGRVSYGVYLVHLLCINLAQKVFPADPARELPNLTSAGAYALACLISVAVAYGLYVAFERPLIEVGRRWSKRLLRAVAPRPRPV